jgi:hypothetical protein
VGTNAALAAHHLGLMVVGSRRRCNRADARQSWDRLLTEAERIVFTDGKPRPDQDALQFYTTMLKKPHTIDAIGGPNRRAFTPESTNG